MINKEPLRQIGMTEREIKVYIALLELGKTTTGPLIKKSKIPSSKVYHTLDRLMGRGLASYVIISKTKYFQATSPENIVLNLESKIKNVEELIPELKQMQFLALDIQHAEVYESMSGLKAAFNNILETVKQGEEYLVFTLGDELKSEELKRFFSIYHTKRIGKKIKVRLIANKKIKEIFSKYHSYQGMAVRYTDLKLPTGIFIYEHKVMTVVWEENPACFVITSKRNAQRYKDFFEEIWDTAEVIK